MASKNSKAQKGEEQSAGMTTRRSEKKSHLQIASSNESYPSLRRSPRLGQKAKPSQAIIAAKKNARLRQSNKKSPEVIVKDIYHTAREAKDMVRKQTGLVYDRSMSEHRCIWDPSYPECPERFTRVLERCEALGLVSRCSYVEPREATEKEILMKHSQEQIEILKATAQCKDEEFLEELSSRYDAIYIHPTTYRLSLLAAGSTIELVDAVCSGKIQNGMAIIRPPGHHAMKSEYCGYCFFNNVALAATHALTYCGVSRILIVDWDVHHGQATQQMFYNDPRVVYFSLHRYEHGNFWPNLRESEYDFVGEGPGAGYNFNIPLNNIGMTDADYLAVFHQVLLPMANEFQPELILVSAGYDAAIGCPEGEMEITPACYAHLLNSLLCLASGKVAVILEGGYCLQSLAEGAALTLRTLIGDPCPPLINLGSPCEGIRETILNVIYAHREYWYCYQFQDKFSVHAEINNNSHHLPAVKFLGSGEKPLKYETRNCYPVQSKEFIENVKRRLDFLISNTKLTFPQHRVCFVYDERMTKYKNISDPGHPEKPERISAIFSRHEEYGLLKRCHILQARSVSEEELLLLHTKEHIDMMRETANMKLSELAKKQDEFQSVYLHPGSYQAACLAAGSVLQVVDSVLNGECRSGIAIVRPPGHHAERDGPCGFCIFNNVSLAAKYAVEIHGLKRVLLLDWDVHHGNGSQHMFQSDPRVLYISLHRYDNGSFFPASKDANYDVVGSGKGEGYNVNIPWNKRGMTVADYLAAFYQVILPISYQFNPELVLISSGFDACIGDPLGGCKVSPEAYGHFTHLMTSLAGGRVILCLEGGYNVSSISYAMPMCTKALLGDPLPLLPPHQVPCPSAVNTIKNVVRTQSKYWSSLCFQIALPQENVLPKPIQNKQEVGVNLTDASLKDSSKSDDTLYLVPKVDSSVEDNRLKESVSEKIVKESDKKQALPSDFILNEYNDSLDVRVKKDNSMEHYDDSSESVVNKSKDVSISDEDFNRLQDSLSNLSIRDRSAAETLSSDFASLDVSPVDSESWSKDFLVPEDKSKYSQEGIQAMESSFSDEGYKSQNLSTATVEESFKEKIFTASDKNDSSSRQSHQSGDKSEQAGASGFSVDTSRPQTLVDYLSDNMQLLLDGEMFAVVPLPSCPHLNRVEPVPANGLDCKDPCVECNSQQENWVCLSCYTVHCGRYVNGHMMSHSLESPHSHPLVLSFADLSVWCYECEAYIDNPVLYAAKNAAHRSKFGDDMPWSYGEQTGKHSI